MNAFGATPRSPLADAQCIDGILFLEEFEETAPDASPTADWPDEDAAAFDERSDVADARRIGFAAGRDAGLHEGRAAGYADGLAAGRADGRDAAMASDAAACRAALDVVAARMDGIATQAERAARIDVQALARLVMTMFAACWPQLAERHGDAEAAALARTLLANLSHEPSIVIRAAPRAATLIADAFGRGGATDLAGRVRVIATDALLPGDLHVAWDQGEAVRDTHALWAEIVATLTQAGLAPETPATPKQETEHAS